MTLHQDERIDPGILTAVSAIRDRYGPAGLEAAAMLSWAEAEAARRVVAAAVVVGDEEATGTGATSAA